MRNHSIVGADVIAIEKHQLELASYAHDRHDLSGRHTPPLVSHQAWLEAFAIDVDLRNRRRGDRPRLQPDAAMDQRPAVDNNWLIREQNHRLYRRRHRPGDSDEEHANTDMCESARRSSR